MPKPRNPLEGLGFRARGDGLGVSGIEDTAAFGLSLSPSPQERAIPACPGSGVWSFGRTDFAKGSQWLSWSLGGAKSLDDVARRPRPLWLTASISK